MLREPLLSIVICLLVVGRCPVAGGEGLDFSRHVQPILADHCLACHGPDAAEGGLRFDDPQIVTQPLESGATAVVSGDVAGSELWRRITSSDPALRMPPEGAAIPAPLQQTLRQWIEEGAAWSQHWAYRPIAAARPPRVQNAWWPRNAIDHFVLANLEQRQLVPAPRSAPEILLKRLCYDLWGLPPTAELRTRFLHDTRPDAYERLVDELLAAPWLGERWGRHWLDLARYADSDGYEKDNPRPHAWRYRDWVLRTVNADLPFDQFTVRQLAGDLLPEATPSDRVATAFHRQTLTNTEGGTDQEEFRVAATFDRVETTATVWLSLTVGCARCHDHKYDAISQRDYYEMFALFNNLDEFDEQLPTGRPGESDTTMKVAMLRERVEERRTTHLLERGDFLRPGDTVEPAALSAISLPVDVHNRQQFVDWLLDPGNPLTSRVMVNHVWLHLFGRGIVPTVDDFGVRGAPPTHPQLLDFLATTLIQEGWSRKQLIRMIVLSSTYQQSSAHRDDLDALDPANHWFHRQNRFRVEAETVRDVYLSLAELLVLELGGPSVFPVMDQEVAALSYANNFKWQTSKGGNAYRRGMYTFFKRTAPHPNLATFDCPDGNTTRVEREISNSPLQALVTLNNDTFVEAAYSLTRRILSDEAFNRVPGDAARMAAVFAECTQRAATDVELSSLLRLLHQSRQYYMQHREDVVALLDRGPAEKATDEGPPDDRNVTHAAAPAAVAPEEEFAAWAVVARCILNLEPILVRE